MAKRKECDQAEANRRIALKNLKGVLVNDFRSICRLWFSIDMLAYNLSIEGLGIKAICEKLDDVLDKTRREFYEFCDLALPQKKEGGNGEA